MLLECQEENYSLKPWGLKKASKSWGNVEQDLKKWPMCVILKGGEETISDQKNIINTERNIGK